MWREREIESGVAGEIESSMAGERESSKLPTGDSASWVCSRVTALVATESSICIGKLACMMVDVHNRRVSKPMLCSVAGWHGLWHT